MAGLSSVDAILGSGLGRYQHVPARPLLVSSGSNQLLAPTAGRSRNVIFKSGGKKQLSRSVRNFRVLRIRTDFVTAFWLVLVFPSDVTVSRGLETIILVYKLVYTLLQPPSTFNFKGSLEASLEQTQAQLN